jgi:prolyl oligopeptidase PreP (S9A serine peptidase family)
MTAGSSFNIPTRLYSYYRIIGKIWLERGSISVIVYIPGEVDFGTDWREERRREGVIRSHDYFAAIAADLVKYDIT